MTKEIQIIGGGFSGLIAAYFQQKKGFSVTLVETNRVGGLIQTLETPYGLVETAANACIANEALEEVAKDIGIELSPVLPSGAKRFIFRNGRPSRWPLSILATFKTFLIILRFILAKKSCLPHKRESIRSWGLRILGTEITEQALIPGLMGIYAGDPDQLSASLILGRFFSGVKVQRGHLKGSVAPSFGMGAFISAMENILRARGAKFATEARSGVETIVALPPPNAAAFLKESAPELSCLLSSIQMCSVASVTIFLPNSARSIDGFGCLFPKSSGLRALGVLANHANFPNRARDGKSETWILGGGLDPKLLQLTDSEILALIQDHRKIVMGDASPILFSRISRWENAFPHYDIVLEEILEKLSKLQFRENNFRLFGTYLGDLGLARVLLKAKLL